MKIESVKTIRGANIYSRQPVVVRRLDLEKLKGRESRRVENFNARLLEKLPKLIEHFYDSGNACLRRTA